MKTTHKITVLAVLLGTSGLATSQTTDNVTTPMENVNLTDNDDDSGKWGLAGLLGLLGLLGLRRNRDNHPQVRGSNTH